MLGDFFISEWLRNKNTLEYLEIYYGEFATIKEEDKKRKKPRLSYINRLGGTRAFASE